MKNTLSDLNNYLFEAIERINDDDLNWLFTEYKEPEVDWSKVKVDTPILVRDFEKAAWERRYFSKFKNGEVYAWNGGLTSWTADDEKNVCIWKYAKLAESEE